MAAQSPMEWVTWLINRFDEQLPYRSGPLTTQTRRNIDQNRRSVVQVAHFCLARVLVALTKHLQKVNELMSGSCNSADVEKSYYESALVLLETVNQCVLGAGERADDTLGSGDDADTTHHHVKRLLREVCHCVYSPLEHQLAAQLKSLASQVLSTLSDKYFSIVFKKFSASLSQLSACGDGEWPQLMELQLLQLVALDTGRLVQLLLEINSHQLRQPLPKTAQWRLVDALEKAICHWLEKRPADFIRLQHTPCEELSKQCEIMFDHLDHVSEKNKRRPTAWPLQMLLLVLCPKILVEVLSGECSAQCSQRLVKKKQFVDSVRRYLCCHSANKALTDAAVMACVNLCKIATYINQNDSNNVAILLVHSIIPDLKGLLFNVLKPFSRGVTCQQQDAELLVEALLALLRIAPHSSAASDVFDACVAADAPPVYHYVLINSLLRVKCQSRLEWWPHIDILYSRSAQLRHLFLEILNKVTQSAEPSSHNALRVIQNINVNLREKVTPTRQKERCSDESVTSRCLLSMVQLIGCDPQLLLSGASGLEMQCSSLELINGLVSLVHGGGGGSAQMATEAMKALLVLHQPDSVQKWNPEAVMNTFWDVSSQVLYSTSQKLIQHQLAHYGSILHWLRQILVCRNQFLRRHREHANIGSCQHICRQAHIKLECVLLMYLWSSEIEVVLVTMSCFASVCEEAEIRSVSDELSVYQLLPNYTVYQELASVSQQLTTGRAALQKRIMALLRRIEYCTQGCLRAWGDTYNKWSHMTRQHVLNWCRCDQASLGEANPPASGRGVAGGGGGGGSGGGKRRSSHLPSDNELEQDQINEWTNMTGFLVALGGVNLPHTNQSLAGSCESSSASSSAAAAAAMAAAGDSRGEDVSDTVMRMQALTCVGHGAQYCPVTQFVSELLLLLVCSHEKYGTTIQKNVKDLVAYQMSPHLYPVLFDQIRVMLDKIFDSQGQVVVNERHSLFVDHIIFVMKKVLDTAGKEGSESLTATSIESTMICLVRYVRQLSVCLASLHVRTRLCQLVERVMLHRDRLAFRHEIRFRNKLLEYLSDWAMAESHHQQEAPLSKCTELAGVSRTLDQACMEAVAVILRGLPLQAEESEHGDLMEAKSEMFSKYLTLFMNLLNATGAHHHTPAPAAVTGGATKRALHCAANRSRWCALRGATIQAMSNMLSANIDAGLSFSLPLGYQPDLDARAAVIEVLTKILQQGTEFSMLAETVSVDRLEQLVQLVTMIGDKGELPIAMALASVIGFSQMDELARVFVTLFDAKHLLPQLLWNMFYREVELTDTLQTLLRGNSLSSKIMAFCFKIYGASFLRTLLEPLIKDAMDSEQKRYEVDPAKLESPDELQQNSDHLLQLAGSVLDAVAASAERFPAQLRIMCHLLYQVLCKRFPQHPQNNLGTVGTMLFLRFINPAIVGAFEYGVVDRQPSDRVRRGLLLTSKILQNVANHVEFAKERHMLAFNDFLRTNFPVARGFFERITSDCETADISGHPVSFISDACVLSLHRLLWTHQEKIGEYVSTSRDHKAVGRRPFDKMATLLAYLGPPEHKPIDYTWSSIDTSATFEEVMFRHNMHEKDDFKCIKNSSIFYQAGSSKLGNPVFYYIARRYKIGETNGDLLIYHALLTLKCHYQKPFEVVIDCTHVSSDNRFRPEFLLKWFVVLPATVVDNIHAVYIYNVNSWVREYIKIHDRILSPLKGSKKIVFVDSLARLADYIDVDQQKLPAGTVALEDDLKVFSNAVRLSHKDTRVTIKVGASSVQITWAERVRVLSHAALLNDVYSVDQVEGVCLVDDSLFTLSLANEAGSLSFVHSAAAAIVSDVLHIRKRHQLSQPMLAPMYQKVRAKDVPGRLLNMALLNLGSNCASLRTAAYNLLCAVGKHFDLKVVGQLLEATGLCIPSNNIIFIKCISEKLAQNEPHLTLEFVTACIEGFKTCSIEHKHLCLEYLMPWLQNLSKFCKSSEDGVHRMLEDNKRQKVAAILERLITLTIDEVQMYPSIQTKVWGSIGQVSELIDMVLDAFIQRSVTAGLASVQSEILADTAVALVSSNVQLVARKIIIRLCAAVMKTCSAPAARLEDHISWPEIGVLTRHLLMLSFNNRLHVTQHLPYLWHLVTMLAATGSVCMRASVHALVINTVHSLCTCTEPQFSEETQRVLLLALDEFSLPKFYNMFGIQVQSAESAAALAFRISDNRPPAASAETAPGPSSSAEASRPNWTDQVSARLCEHPTAAAAAAASGGDAPAAAAAAAGGGELSSEPLSLPVLESLVDALLEIVDVCAPAVAAGNCRWLSVWLGLAKSVAFSYNPALRPRALVALGCISSMIGSVKRRCGETAALTTTVVSECDVKQILHALVKALEQAAADLTLIESIVICLTRLQPQLPAESVVHQLLFWVAIAMLQLDVTSLYAGGLALLEQNLQTLEHIGRFDTQTLEEVVMSAREPLEWYFKLLDQSAGLSFKGNFHFALVGHLLKGFRHPDASVVSRTAWVLNMLLSIVAGRDRRDKFRVTPHSIAYLTALVSVSEEVRSRCRLRFSVDDQLSYSCSSSSLCADIGSSHQQAATAIDCGMGGQIAISPSVSLWSPDSSPPPSPPRSSRLSPHHRRQQQQQEEQQHQEQEQEQLQPEKESQQDQQQQQHQQQQGEGEQQQQAEGEQQQQVEEEEVFGEQVLLDAVVLADSECRLLVVALLASVARHTTDAAALRVLYRCLAEASQLFPTALAAIHFLLDAQIQQVLSNCYDRVVLHCVHCIIRNMLTVPLAGGRLPGSPAATAAGHTAAAGASAGSAGAVQPDSVVYPVQTYGFAGLCRFAAPFSNVSGPVNAEQFRNCLEAMLDTCWTCCSESNHQQLQLQQPPGQLQLLTTSASFSPVLTAAAAAAVSASPITSPTSKVCFQTPF